MSGDGEVDVHDEWGVIGPDGRMWTYTNEVVARIVAEERGKDLHHRTVTRSEWTLLTPPKASKP